MDCTITFSKMVLRFLRILPKKIAITAMGIEASMPLPALSAM